MRQPGIEPGSTAWKAAMLTTIPLTLTSAASLLLVDCEDEGLGPQHKKKKNGVERRQREKKKMDKRVKNKKKNKNKKKGHCCNQDSNLGYCGHNAGS